VGNGSVTGGTLMPWHKGGVKRHPLPTGKGCHHQRLTHCPGGPVLLFFPSAGRYDAGARGEDARRGERQEGRMAFYDKTVEQVLTELKTTRSGLTGAEAEARLGQYGRNELTRNENA